ncbi:MAG: hypothetical protein AB7E60_13340 [Sphingobium sp.]
MNGGSTIVEFWRDGDGAVENTPQSDDILLLQRTASDMNDAAGEEEDDELSPPPAMNRNEAAVRALCLIAGLGWLGFGGWAFHASGQWQAGPAAWPGIVATLLVPIILLGVAYLLLMRTSRAESRRYIDGARALRGEADRLEVRMARIADRLETTRRAMEDQACLLDSYGAAASGNMEASAKLIADRAGDTARSAAEAERAATAVAARMDALIASIPDLEDRANRMAGQIMDNGHALSERIDAMEGRLHALAELSDEARARTLSATKSLSAQLKQMQEATRAASGEVSGMADIAAGRIDATVQNMVTAMASSRDMLTDQAAALEELVARANRDMAQTGRDTVALFTQNMSGVDTDLRGRLDAALSHARQVLAVTDSELTAQTAALEALIDRARAGVDGIGGQAVAGFADTIGEVEKRLRQLDHMVERQHGLVADLQSSLVGTIGVADERFTALEGSALARSERMTDALQRLTAETQRIDTALASGGATAERMIACAESLLLALDASVRELDETFPGALERFDNRLEASRTLLVSITPEIQHVEAISEALAGRAQESEEMLRGQGQRLTEWLDSTRKGLETNRAQVEKLHAAFADAHEGATRITEGAGPLLITALLRVKDTAEQAAERARQALGRAIPDAAQSLADASEEAMRAAVDEQVTTQINRVALVAEDAVRAANQASDRLLRQLHTITETSASVEQRIEEAERAVENRDRDNFARRSALLIDSLNSAAIDVTKLLSNDVADASWAAYLKGDRGVFARRAVKLLDAGEVHSVAQLYDDNPEFRDHVNRYIHDFESMLRVILSARDGNALGVAILSSDMGKLYVALAQAIERLGQ